MDVSSSALAHREIRIIILGVMLAMLLGALDQTIVATALPTIGADLGDFANLSWVVTAYLIASTAVAPLYGKLSDVHGRRVMMLIAISIFTLASIACALAPTLLTLVLARGLQGLGGGGLISLAQTIIADVVSPRERGRYQAQIAAVFAAASVAGPVLGGFFAQHLHWSFIFWINLPLGLAAYLMTDRTLKRLPRHDRRHQVDIIGSALMVISSTSLLLALTWGGVRFPWLSPAILSLFAVFALTAGLFIHRMATAREPFVSLDILTDGVVGKAIPAAFIAAGLVVGLSIYVPLYLETVRNFTASQSGLGLIPLMGGIVCGAVTSGRLMPRLAHYKRPAMVGSLLAACGLFILASLPVKTPIAALIVLLAFTGAGLGTVLPVCTIALQNAVHPHQTGTVTGVMNFFRQMGGAFLVAVLGALLIGMAGAKAGVAGASGVEDLVRGGASPALNYGFTFVFGAAGLALVICCLFVIAMEERPLRTSVKMSAEESGVAVAE